MLGSSTSQNLAKMKLTNCAHLDFGDPYSNLRLDDLPLGSPLGFWPVSGLAVARQDPGDFDGLHLVFCMNSRLLNHGQPSKQPVPLPVEKLPDPAPTQIFHRRKAMLNLNLTQICAFDIVQDLGRSGPRQDCISKDLGLVRIEYLERSGDRFISWW